MKLTPGAKAVINQLNNSGYSAYAVGGFVRNVLLGIPVSDVDVTTSATPEQMLEVFKNFISADMSLNTVLEHHIELGLPSFASILRARRKVQEKHPELVNETAATIREAERKEYKAYALNN